MFVNGHRVRYVMYIWNVPFVGSVCSTMDIQSIIMKPTFASCRETYDRFKKKKKTEWKILVRSVLRSPSTGSHARKTHHRNPRTYIWPLY